MGLNYIFAIPNETLFEKPLEVGLLNSSTITRSSRTFFFSHKTVQQLVVQGREIKKKHFPPKKSSSTTLQFKVQFWSGGVLSWHRTKKENGKKRIVGKRNWFSTKKSSIDPRGAPYQAEHR
ncbi:hypothetical protein JTE90_010121 [Oedothorax gibbosus]|uniref:Ribosomal protein L32 n=1 Tax=Oedothorax gibbosus TaxID=931172 RepID=A0AAV6UD96_9ARAC|nr:hypothetical protein JTE90_010121 [Oedothorax gibbosus]